MLLLTELMLEQALPKAVGLKSGLQHLEIAQLFLVGFITLSLLAMVWWLRYRAAHPLSVPTSLQDALNEPETRGLDGGDEDDAASWWKNRR